MTDTGPHRLTRPLWLCEVDGLDWPCAEARHALLERYRDDRSSLGQLLTGFLYLAAWDLRDTPAADREVLFERFLEWSLLPLPRIGSHATR